MATAAQQAREKAMALMSLKPEGGAYPQDYTGVTTKRGVKDYNEGEELHHRAIVKIYEPFFTGLNEHEARLLVDFLESEGVPMGNNPRNFTGMPKDQHIGSDGIHQFAADVGIQLKGDDTRLTKGTQFIDGSVVGPMEPFLDKIRASDLQTRMDILPDFIEYGQGMLDEKMRDMGYQYPTRQEFKQMYQADAERDMYKSMLREKVEGGDVLNTRGNPEKNAQKLSSAYIDKLRPLL